MENYQISARQRRERRRRKQQMRRRRFFTFLGILFITASILIILFLKYESEHFRKNTVIDNVDCSRLTVEEAYQKINEYLANQTITYLFVNDTFSNLSKLYSIKLDSTSELEDILESQNEGDKSRTYTLTKISINDLKVKEHLLSFPCFNEENMKMPENAYLKLGEDSLFYIVPETLGNVIDFDEAYQFALETLKSGSTTIDFRTITTTLPEILSSNEKLVAKKEELNSILSTTINYSLSDGTIVTLDSNIISDWLYEDDNGLYQIDLDSNISDFVDTLYAKVSETNSHVSFNATDLGPVSIYIPKSRRVNVDKVSEIEQLKKELGTSQTYNRSPIYQKGSITITDIASYVEIDITRQTVWMYKDGVCIVNTPCVTGNASNHNTPTGIFNLTYKTTDTYLQGYNDDGSRYKSYVNYWMPFNGGIGLHDALWRDADEFGGTTYKGNGSHGCVNLPLSAAKTIYNNIDSNMPIIVYAS